MSVWVTAVCKAKREIFRPDGWRDHHMRADGAQLVELMLSDWFGQDVVMVMDDDDLSHESWDWPNRWKSP